MKNQDEIFDDEVTVIGGSEWNPGTGDPGYVPVGKKPYQERWKTTAIVLGTVLVLSAVFLLSRHLLYQKQFLKSRPDREIIARLTEPVSGRPGISMKVDDCLGVRMKIFAIDGLEAHFADTVPDCTDMSVYLVTRSADYRIKNDRREIIGDFVQDGEVLSRSRWRAGFMAIVDGQAQIGVSRSDRVFRYVLRHDGSFFRQMALVSSGSRCDGQYILRGKVSRCAYARDIDGRLYFVETVYPEGLQSFADALIEYGFTDAVYVTGGAQPDLFYRTPDGVPHGNYSDDKPHKLVIWTCRTQTPLL